MSKPIDIKYFKNLSNKNKRNEINVKELIEENKKTSILSKQKYKVLYNNCINKIKEGIRKKEIDMIYTIPLVYLEIPDYKPEKCLKYIKKYLEKNNIYANIISDSKIYINWS